MVKGLRAVKRSTTTDARVDPTQENLRYANVHPPATFIADYRMALLDPRIVVTFLFYHKGMEI
jgi:hypothetical protein